MARHVIESDLAGIFAKAQKDAQKRWETEPTWASFTRASTAMRMDGKEIGSGRPRYGRWVKKTDTVVMDFKGKISGNLSVPHVARNRTLSTFGTPLNVNPDQWIEFSQDSYNRIISDDDSIKQDTSSTSGVYAQHMLSFNVLQDLKNKGIVPQSWTADDLKLNAKRAIIVWIGYGKGSNGGVENYGSTEKVWMAESNEWSLFNNHGSNVPQRAETTLNVPSTRIDNEGKMHILTHSTYPSDGTISSVVYTDYVSLEITVEQWVLEENGIFIEEGTTNLLTANQSSVEISTEGFAEVEGATIERVVGDAWHGNSCLKVTCPGISGSERVNILGSVQPNGIYTASAYVKGPAGKTVMVLFREKDSVNEILDEVKAIVTLTGVWQRVSLTKTFGENGRNMEFHIRNNVSESKTFYVDGLQLEQKPYATSWILGGTTRSFERLNVLNPMTPEVGCLRQWVYIDEMAKRQVEGQWNTVVRLTRHPIGTGISFAHWPNYDGWTFEINDGTNSYTNIIPSSETPNGWYLIEIKWTKAQATLTVSGVTKFVVDNPPLPEIFGQNLYIGGDTWDGGVLNAFFGQTQLLSHYPTDEESLAAYNQGVNGLTWDEHTLALYDWSDRLYSGYIPKSVMLSSPNGSAFTLTVADDGTLTATPVS